LPGYPLSPAAPPAPKPWFVTAGMWEHMRG